MNILLNIIWHIPFLGFIYAGIYALCGLILCLTIIGMPLGVRIATNGPVPAMPVR
ncbi:MAG: YccF domain-containing protein [Barnesiella sp.]